MLIDCFPYFNEVELLKLRYEVLKDHVDGFVIAEADRTHRGDPKPFTLERVLEEQNIPFHNIFVVRSFLPSREEAEDPWVRERGQRDALGEALKKLPGDTVFVCSDCDELPNPYFFDEIKEYLAVNPNEVCGLDMSMHYGRADLQLCSDTGELFNWRCATACKVSTLLDLGSITAVRNRQGRHFIGNRDGGWHFSWMGNAERRRTKLSSIAEHYMWDTPEVQSLCDSFIASEGKSDMLGRKDHILTEYPVENLPPEVFKIESVYTYLFPA